MRSDPVSLIRRDGRALSGIMILQVDDLFTIGTKEFLRGEEEASKKLISKPIKPISVTPSSLNGLKILKTKDGSIKIYQQENKEKLNSPENQNAFESQHALAQYIGVCTRPDVCADVQLIASESEPTKSTEYKTFVKTIKHLQNTKDMGLTNKRLDMSTVRFVVITDAILKREKRT